MKLRRLKFYTSKVGSGKTPRGGAAVYVSNGVMLLRSQNVHFDGLRLDDVVFISDEADEEMSNSRVEPLDVLLNITGASLGRCAVAPSDIGKANVNQHVAILRCNQDSILPRFLCYSLQSAPVQNQIWANENGSSREGLNFEQIGNFPLPESKLSEQQLISDYLDQETGEIDELIREKEGMLTLLEEKRSALISHLVTRGVNAKVTLKDSGFPWLGSIPKHWPTQRSKRLLIERDERSVTGEEEMLTVSHLTGVTKRSEKDVNMFEADSNEGYKCCSPGDLAINTLWAWMGAMGVSQDEGIVSPAYHVYRITDDLLPAYVDALVRTPAFVAEVTRFSKGVWSSRLRLYPEGLYEVWLPVPPIKEQAAIVEAIQQEKTNSGVLESALRDSITLLKERRAALITAAVTGQIPLNQMKS